MFSFGIEILFLGALTIVIITVFLFYLVLVRVEPQAKPVSVEDQESAEKEYAESPEEITQGPSIEAQDSLEIAPVEPPESPEAVPAETEREPGPPGCPHYLGYLKGRPRDGDDFAPDECLSCPRILECLEK